MSQPLPPKNRCHLCGTRTHGVYCWAHTWAAGPPPVAVVERYAPERPAGLLGTVARPLEKAPPATSSSSTMGAGLAAPTTEKTL